jgi:hypothetical protein
MLERWKILVAPRCGPPNIPAIYGGCVRTLPYGGYDEHSSSRVRELLATDQDCCDLVDDEILGLVREIYRRHRR